MNENKKKEERISYYSQSNADFYYFLIDKTQIIKKENENEK